MQIDISKIDKTRFFVNEKKLSDIGDVYHIVPHKAMWEWKDDELHLRSLMTDPDGNVVSAGFPKFFNLGECPQDDNILLKSFQDKKVRVFDKLDGSLIIRSEINGKVHFRTRGAVELSLNVADGVNRLLKDKFPNLLLPGLTSDKQSLLMEYTCPTNQVVLKYKQSNLTPLAITDWSNGELKVGSIPQNIINVFEGVIPEEFHDFDTVDCAVKKLESVTHSEGVVAWRQEPCGFWRLTKIKTPWYIQLHSLRSQTSTKSIVKLMVQNDAYTVEKIKKFLAGQGMDWETISFIHDKIGDVVKEFDSKQTIKRKIDSIIESKDKTGLNRRDLAFFAKDLSKEYEEWSGYIMSKIMEDSDKTVQIGLAISLGMTFNQFVGAKKERRSK